nr:zonadhesin-like protein 14 [Limnephilus flavicornis]
MRILMIALFCCVSATLATYTAAPPTPVGCGGDPNAESKPCGDPCPITCENKDAGGPKICPRICIVNGCGCKAGFVKDVKGKCILPAKCPAPPTPVGCGGDPNAVSKPCGDPCPITCENKDAGGPQICAAICIVDGCGCKTGFVKDVNGKCILPANCPAPPTPVGCGGDPNAESKPCGDPCPITCENKDAGGPMICPAICIVDGCGCKTGFVKDVNGKCILPDKCPKPTCAKNEVYSTCKNPCPETCEQLVAGGPQIMCMPPFPCPGGCDCASGYVRNKNNICVLLSQCPCPDPNAELVNCPNPCPPTCDNLATFGKTPCARMCLATGCTCKKGFVFDSKGKCIKPNKCPKICKK